MVSSAHDRSLIKLPSITDAMGSLGLVEGGRHVLFAGCPIRKVDGDHPVPARRFPQNSPMNCTRTRLWIIDGDCCRLGFPAHSKLEESWTPATLAGYVALGARNPDVAARICSIATIHHT